MILCRFPSDDQITSLFLLKCSFYLCVTSWFREEEWFRNLERDAYGDAVDLDCILDVREYLNEIWDSVHQFDRELSNIMVELSRAALGGPEL
jgi:hypothetical protein